MIRGQRGFTLVEIAVVLVIVGLLLGGVLKGRELIASARVRSLADQQAAVQAAYHGFTDRYRALPGDMPRARAEAAIGETINTGDSAGTGNGRLEAPPAWEELNGVWEHLVKAGFIKGEYNGSSDAPTPADAPVNAFNGVLVLARHDGYRDSGTPRARLLLHMGQHVPVAIARELDVKVDDGRPLTGILRNAATGTAVHEADDGATPCIDTDAWDTGGGSRDCNPTFLY